jgi:hypothetical protein
LPLRLALPRQELQPVVPQREVPLQVALEQVEQVRPRLPALVVLVPVVVARAVAHLLHLRTARPMETLVILTRRIIRTSKQSTTTLSPRAQA